MRVTMSLEPSASMRLLLHQLRGHALAPLQLTDQHRADDRNQHHQREHERHSGDRRRPPWREQFLPFDGREQDERKAAAALVEADALHPIQRRLEVIGPVRPAQVRVAEQRRVGKAAPHIFCIVRVARDDGTVGMHQRDRAVPADLELLVEAGQVVGAHGREHHAAEAAVLPVEAPRQGDHPFAVDQALDGMADIGLAPRRELVIAQKFVVAERAAHRARRRQPVALGVDDGEAVKPVDRLLARLEDVVQLGDRGGIGAVHLQPPDGADHAGIEQVEAVLGVLVQRARHVRHLGLGALEQRVARAPFAPRADAENGGAGEHDECRSPQRQAPQTGSGGIDVHRAGNLR
jgi:hypothetical protein